MREPMRIIDIQRRIHEVGRLRLGRQVVTKRKKGNTEETTTRPERIDRFRFTSRNERATNKAAEVYGGEPHPWENAPGEAPQWEVFSDARELDEVIVPPTAMAFSQSYEDWTGGSAQRRCNGERMVPGDQPCLCAQEMDAGKERVCKPTTRLNVMLLRLGAFGVWRLETHGWNAAAELGGAVELAQMAAHRGMHSARLRIDTRTAKVPKRGGGTMTTHFVVPVLDLDLPLEELLPASSPLHGLPPAPAQDAEGEPGRGNLTPIEPGPPAPAPTIAGQLEELDSRQARPTSRAAEPLQPTGRRARAAEAAPSPEEGAQQGPEGSDRSEGDEAGDPGAEERARNVAIACDKAAEACGVASKDRADWRHRFLAAASKGAYASAKEVPAEHVPALMAALVKVKRGELELRSSGRGKAKRWEVVVTATGKPAEQSDVRPEAEAAPTREEAVEAGSQDWDRARWMATLENVPGVGQAKLMGEARRIAPELEVELPASLDDVTDPRLVTQLLGWLKSKQGE